MSATKIEIKYITDKMLMETHFLEELPIRAQCIAYNIIAEGCA